MVVVEKVGLGSCAMFRLVQLLNLVESEDRCTIRAIHQLELEENHEC